MNKRLCHSDAFEAQLDGVAHNRVSLRPACDLDVRRDALRVLTGSGLLDLGAVCGAAIARRYNERETAHTAQVIQSRHEVPLDLVLAGFAARKVLDVEVSKVHIAPRGLCAVAGRRCSG